MGSSAEKSPHRGVIPRVAEQITKSIKDNAFDASGNQIEFNIMASYLEIYNEKLQDLLCDQDEQAELKIRNDPLSTNGKGLFIEGITQKVLCNESDYVRLIEKG